MVESAVESVAGVDVELAEKMLIRVLHVDDDVGFLKTAKQSLEMQDGFQVETALSVEEAMEKMRESEFDAIVCDYVMPGKDGLEFLKELREEGNIIPFIIFTGKGREEVAIKALNLGADRYINKIGKPEAVYYELSHGIGEIVKLRKSEEALLENEKRYRSFVENFRGIAFRGDKNFRMEFFHGAVKEITGYTSEDFAQGRVKWTDIIHKDDSPRVLEDVKRVIAEKRRNGEREYRIVRKDGKVRWVVERVQCIFDDLGNVIGAQGTINDVTERRQIEKSLLESEERLRSLVESAEDIIVVQDLDGRYLYYNAAPRYGLKTEEIVGKTTFDFFDSATATEMMERVKQVASSGQSLNFETQLACKEETLWFSDLIYPIQDATGRVNAVGTISRNITKRKRAERSLKESEEKWRSLVNNTSDYVIVVDDKGKVGYINKAIPPHEPAQITGKSIYDYSPKDYHSAMKEDLANLFKTGRPGSHESALNHPLGIRWFRTKTVPIKGKEKVLNAIMICEDITERKEIEEELRRSEVKFRSLVDNTASGVIAVDVEGKFTFVNAAICDMIGYSENELTGKQFAQFIHPDDRDKVLQIFRNFMRNPELKPDFEFRVIHKKGHNVYLRSAPTLLKHEKEIVGSQAIITDITERKRVEETIRDSEEKFRSIFENASDAMIYLDKSGRILDVNKKAVKVFGGSKKEVVGKHFTKVRVFSRKDLPRLISAFTKSLAGKKPTLDIRIENKKGEEIYLECLGSAVEADGKTIGNMIIARDISERKQAEQALKKSEERWRSLVELAPAGIVTVNKTGVITSINPAFSNLTGYSKDEIVGKHFTKIGTIRARDIPKYMKMFTSTMRGKIPPPQEFTYIRKDGTTRWGDVHSGLLKEGSKITGFQAILRDITERKKAEEALREVKERWVSLTENTDDILMIVDNKGVIQQINRTIPPYTPEETVGKSVYEYVPKEQYNIMSNTLRKVFNTGKPESYEISSNIPQAGTIWFSTKAVPIKHDGKVTNVILISSDITSRRKAEQELKKTLEKMHTLNEKLNVIGKLTRHDVRNKLSAVINNLYLTKQRLTDDPKALEHLSDIESACEQIVRIFDFARTYEMLGVEELVDIDVEKSLEEATSLFSDLHGVKVINDCHGLSVLADSLLRQLFYNLIDNSLKYGEEISQIRVHCEKGKNKLELIYEDDGVGIPKAKKEKIFQEGYGKGTGYGLYLIKKMCEVYGWNIKETGKHGKGAQFTITIPTSNNGGIHA